MNERLESIDFKAAYNTLSSRQGELLCNLAQGLEAEDIATKFGISKRTVEAHKSQIAVKLSSLITGEEIEGCEYKRIIRNAVGLGIQQNVLPQSLPTGPFPALTPTENIVAKQISKGFENKEISQNLRKDQKTVEAMIGKIRHKYRVEGRRTALVARIAQVEHAGLLIVMRKGKEILLDE